MIDIVVDEDVQGDFSSEKVAKVAEKCCFEAKSIKKPSLCVRFSNNDVVQQLNAAWRDKDKVTDVLSFPMQEEDDFDEDDSLGDIIIAVPFVAEEAKRLDLDFDAHMYHLITHGTLHLLGYDHINDDEAETMQRLENKIMEKLDLHMPYPELDS